jgi:hypothetical protein
VREICEVKRAISNSHPAQRALPELHISEVTALKRRLRDRAHGLIVAKAIFPALQSNGKGRMDQ